jgi:hypothetical protein
MNIKSRTQSGVPTVWYRTQSGVPTVWYFLVLMLYACLLYWYTFRGNKVGQTISENIHSHYFRILCTYFIFRRDIFLTGVSGQIPKPY